MVPLADARFCCDLVDVRADWRTADVLGRCRPSGATRRSPSSPAARSICIHHHERVLCRLSVL
eukprot:3459086-Prymnesium_polylepis.1